MLAKQHQRGQSWRWVHAMAGLIMIIGTLTVCPTSPTISATTPTKTCLSALPISTCIHPATPTSLPRNLAADAAHSPDFTLPDNPQYAYDTLPAFSPPRRGSGIHYTYDQSHHTPPPSPTPLMMAGFIIAAFPRSRRKTTARAGRVIPPQRRQTQLHLSSPHHYDHPHDHPDHQGQAAPETGLYYYGYRYYDPVTGRWPSRDPIKELSHSWFNLIRALTPENLFIDMVFYVGINDFSFVSNKPITGIDAEGRIRPVVAAGLVGATGYGAWQAGSAIGDWMVDVMEEMEDHELHDEEIEDEDDPFEANEKFCEKKRALGGSAKKIGESGSKIPGTGLQGPPPAPATKAADLVSEAANKVIQKIGE